MATAEIHREQRLGGGNFYGAIHGKQELCDAIFTDLQHRSPRKLPAHSHELAFFALLLEGDYREHYNRQQLQFGPFSLAFRPAGVPHQDEIGPRGVRFFEIEVGPKWQKCIGDSSGSLDTACDDLAGGELLWLAMKLFRETRGEADELAIETVLAEMLGAVARISRSRMNDVPHWLSRIEDKLRSEYCERLTLDELGQEAGVHPVHLSRVFRRCVGEGIGEYVHRLRIRDACKQMLAPEVSLAEIALATGFADQSHFTRAFRRVTGLSPAAFRMLIGAKHPPTAAASVGNAEDRLARCNPPVAGSSDCRRAAR